MLTASEIAAAVRAGDLDPVSAVKGALTDICLRNDVATAAFKRVRTDEALAEARSLTTRTDLDALALAGVPIAVKEVVAVAGEYAPQWCLAQVPQPFPADSDIVARLRAAGAVIVGLTRAPEFCLWPMTDNSDAIVCNPWAHGVTAGGSSGGSAAAVAGGLVPIAHGTDALGSLRSPAAICGLVGFTPGRGTVPAGDSADWSGMYTHGPLATTVSDAALLLSVLAQRPELAEIPDPGRLRIAISSEPPGGGASIAPEFNFAVMRTAELLAAAGHSVGLATPHYGCIGPAIATRWLAGPTRPPDKALWGQLEGRTRTHMRASNLVRSARAIRLRPQRAWIARAEQFFTQYDVLITPTLAAIPPASLRWGEKSWLANVQPAARMNRFLGPWSLAGFPAMSVPAGRTAPGFPVGIQLVAPRGGERRLLSLAAQLETLDPWPRTVDG
jgi:amidase